MREVWCVYKHDENGLMLFMRPDHSWTRDCAEAWWGSCDDAKRYSPLGSGIAVWEPPATPEPADVEALCLKLARTLKEKGEKYGDAIRVSAKVLAALYPNGVKPEDYEDLLLVTRITDKLCRVAHGNSDKEEDYLDIAGYGVRGAERKK